MSAIDRLQYDGNLERLIFKICMSYSLGQLQEFTVIEVGYEDCNVIVKAENGKYVVKMFAKTRSQDEVNRYVTIIRKVISAGVRHPRLLISKDKKIVSVEQQVSFVVMEYIDGNTFFELDREPNQDELRKVLYQAAKINSIDFKPSYLFDSWAIPNIKQMFDKVAKFIKNDDLILVNNALKLYETIDADNLPHCLVHGDLTKANVMINKNEICVLDFSVANWYPRIQELAVIIANLLYDNNSRASFKATCELVANEYSKFNQLTTVERQSLPIYSVAGIAMEFLGSHQEKYINGNDNAETDFWLNLGRRGLVRAFSEPIKEIYD